jgi:hypothetical protein
MVSFIILLVNSHNNRLTGTTSPFFYLFNTAKLDTLKIRVRLLKFPVVLAVTITLAKPLI